MSHHIPIILKFSAIPIQLPTRARLNFKRPNWENFKDEINNNIRHVHIGPTATLEHIDAHLQEWYNATDTSIKTNMPATRRKTLPHTQLSHTTRNTHCQTRSHPYWSQHTGMAWRFPLTYSPTHTRQGISRWQEGDATQKLLTRLFSGKTRTMTWATKTLRLL